MFESTNTNIGFKKSPPAKAGREENICSKISAAQRPSRTDVFCFSAFQRQAPADDLCTTCFVQRSNLCKSDMLLARSGCGSTPRKPLVNIKIGSTWVFIRPTMEPQVMTHGPISIMEELHIITRSFGISFRRTLASARHKPGKRAEERALA